MVFLSGDMHLIGKKFKIYIVNDRLKLNKNKFKIRLKTLYI